MINKQIVSAFVAILVVCLADTFSPGNVNRQFKDNSGSSKKDVRRDTNIPFPKFVLPAPVSSPAPVINVTNETLSGSK